MATLENYGSNKGWWFLAQLLIGEQKSSLRKKEYRIYCAEFADFLSEYGPPRKQEQWSQYTHGQK